MYSLLLVLHSLLRWLVLAGLLYTLFLAYRGWFSSHPFTKKDNLLRVLTVTLTHVQLLIGLGLYAISPLVTSMFHSFGEAMGQREIRFFGMEHSLMMLIAVILITIGSAKAKRKPTDKEKFKTLAIWFTIGLVLILASIPWSFSPLVSRPDFRGF